MTFSIVIPTLNEEHYLPLILSDLENQTFSDFELIIVDAQSEDKTISKAKRFGSRFKYFTILSSRKRNVSSQRNLGASKAKTEWLIFLDADNRIPKYFLQGIKYRIESSNADIISTRILPDSKSNKEKLMADIVNLLVDLQKSGRNPFIMESFLAIRKKVFSRLKGFNEKLLFSEGSDLMKRALKLKAKFAFEKDPVYVCSFRRFRKKGSYKHLLNLLLIEFTRLTNIKLPEETIAHIYPMGGGKLFNVDSKTTSRLKKIYMKIASLTK